MTEPPHRPGDPYSRVEYRRLIAWGRRIARESPWLRELLETAPETSVLDLGCGTGEHVAFFADEGARAVGLDRSEAMIEAAREYEADGRGTFVLSDALDARDALRGHAPFGLAICLGNMLPHLREDAELDRFLAAAHDLLRPGGALLIQMLNYARILAGGIRHLPVNVREDEDGGEIVFLRILTPAEDGRILFFPTTLALDPDAEEPITVKTTRRVELRAWTADDLAPHFERHGFDVTLHGNMQGGPFDPETSHDLVVFARRRHE